jgi:hypothetical protein
VKNNRFGQIAAAVLVAAIGFTAVQPLSGAFAVSRTNIVSYAKQYACNLDESCRNTGSYQSLGATDCANFVSQALRAGGYGLIQTGSSTQQWFYLWVRPGVPTSSATWTSVGQLMGHLLVSGRVSLTTNPAMDATYSGATGGDVYFYDWGGTEGWSHAAVSTNSGTFSSFFDSASGRSYSSITKGVGDRIAQHSNDRVDSPWNFGYWIQTNLATRSKMKTVVYHLN